MQLGRLGRWWVAKEERRREAGLCGLARERERERGRGKVGWAAEERREVEAQGENGERRRFILFLGFLGKGISMISNRLEF